MDRRTVTQRVAHYLQDNHISAEIIERQTGIPADRLTYGSGVELEAAEFLELCRYLNVRPESFRRTECDDTDARFTT